MKRITKILSAVLVISNLLTSTASAVLMYHPDGRVRVVEDELVPEWKSYGWYEQTEKGVHVSDEATDRILLKDDEEQSAGDEYKENKITMYSPDGKTIVVEEKDAKAYYEKGWYYAPVVTMYNINGNTTVVAKENIEEWKGYGWYLAPVVTMYDINGNTTVVAKENIEQWKGYGWYLAPVVTMYAANGNTTVVAKENIEQWKDYGWYEVPMTTVYTLDGRSQVIAQSDVYSWKAAGWYLETDKVIMYALDGRTEKIFIKDISAWESVGWKILPPTGTVMYSNTGRRMVINNIDVDMYRELGWKPTHEYFIGKIYSHISSYFTDLRYEGDDTGGCIVKSKSGNIFFGFSYLDFNYSKNSAKCTTVHMKISDMYPGIHIIADKNGKVSQKTFDNYVKVNTTFYPAWDTMWGVPEIVYNYNEFFVNVECDKYGYININGTVGVYYQGGNY